MPDGWPWALLTVPGKTIYELSGDPPAVLSQEKQGILSVRTFQVQDPPLHLYLYEFASYGDASDAYDSVLEASGEDGKPWHPDLVINGAWLLVVGLPSHKPLSPEMESARTEFVSAFAGEE